MTISEQTSNAETAEKDSLLQKIHAQINEERLLKDLSAIQLNRFKPLDDLAHEIRASERRDDLRRVLDENLTENQESILSRYIIGLFGLEAGNTEEIILLRGLLKDFRRNAKWTITDHIADRILEKEPNNRFALRAKVESTERIKGKKELAPFLERLAFIDRKNPDIAKKYALSILEEDKKKALSFLKQAGETYARLKDYKNLEDVWNLVIEHDHGDMPFFERIERVLVGNREKARAAAYLMSLLEPYRLEEDWSAVINILKKILEYEPASTRARSDLVRAYRAKYAEHSLLDDFLKMSELTNNRKPVSPCIASFERNIVFDNGNYVYHRTRDVGQIKEIDNNQVVIDFRDNPGQVMSIQMAISSLKPLEPDHIWVRHYENPGEIEEIFREDIAMFFEILLSSFGYRMTLSEIKTEICGKYLPADEWSKWWSRARTRLKKEPKFGFNPKKKDELLLRDTPMTLSEELILKFQSQADWNKKLEMAVETLKDPDTEDAAMLCSQFFHEQEKSKDHLKKIHCFLFLSQAASILGDEYVKRTMTESEFNAIISGEKAQNLVVYCAETPVVDFKRELVNRFIKNRTDYPDILKEILFELPSKVNRHIISELNRLGQTDTLQAFLKKAFSKFRDYPEVFLWAARSVLTEQWNEGWVQYSKADVVLLVFRLLKPLARIEKKGTRLKNMAIETLFGTTNITVESTQKGVLPEIVQSADMGSLRRMSVIFREVPYIPDAHKENFLDFIQSLRPDFEIEADVREAVEEERVEEEAEKSLLPEENVILVSPLGLEKRKAYLDRLINVEMPANSRDIGEAQEKGDLRENAEYKAAMERQGQLQAEIRLVDEELKRARLISTDDIREDVVSIGTRVQLVNNQDRMVEYEILGPWEADAENRIISYLSPLAGDLLGKKPGDEASLGDQGTFRIEKIISVL